MKRTPLFTAPLERFKGDFGGVLGFFYLAVSISLIVTFLGAGSGGAYPSAAKMTALLWAVACFGMGTTAGFLFGIPKILQNAPTATQQGSANEPKSDLTYGQQVNTNLTDISDWLTKIIVGLGLIHLKEIPPFVKTKAAILAAALKPEVGTADYLAFAISVIVTFSVFGFLFGYISTRMYLAAAFARADLEAINSATRTTAESASARTEVLREEVSLLKKTLLQAEVSDASTIARMVATINDVPQPETEVKQDPLQDLYDLAKEYNEFRSQSKQERISVRSDLAERMAIILNNNRPLREKVANEALQTGDNGLIAGLAVAITTDPELDDVDRLLKVAPLAKYLHCQNKVAVAIGRLFADRLATKEDIERSVNALELYKPRADSSLQRRIQETLSLIAQTTSTNIPSLA